MARVFMSTLGTGNYVECHYRLGDSQSELVVFVQEALVSLLCGGWSSEDKIVVFCTSDAQEKNWEDSGNFSRGLKSRLEDLKLKAPIKMVSIPDGKNEGEIMEIFEKMVGELNQGDEVVLDITHSFRSIPMLATVVLNYAKIVKNISVTGIYYGAFEVLGAKEEVKKMNKESRIAPIFDLTPFDELLDWGSAIKIFLKSGNADEIQALTGKRIGLLFKNRQKTDSAENLKKFVNRLKSLCTNLMTARGSRIYEEAGTFGFAESINALEKETIVAPLKPLLELLRPELEPFDADSRVDASLNAVKWCIERGLIPQAYILLYELSITEFCQSFGLDPMEEQDRNFVSSLASVIAQKKSKEEWKGELAKRKELACRILKIGGDELKRDFEKLQSLGGMRNDFMHGGWRRNPTSPKKLMEKIQKALKEISPVLKKHSAGVAKKGIFLISHEPSPEQIRELEEKWGVRSIVKMPEDIAVRWRAIPPDVESIKEEILPVRKWIDDVCKPGDVVVVQGDYGASFMLANYVKKIGCTPLYATTERKVDERVLDDGSVEQKRLFRHVRFREYEFLTW